LKRTDKLKYKNLNFNLKNIIFDHIPLIQIFEQMTKIDKSTQIALKKNLYINFIKNNLDKLKEYIPEYDSLSIDKIKNLCSLNCNFTEKNIENMVVFLFIKTLSSRKAFYLKDRNLGVNENNMMYLSECLKVNTSIQILNINNNNLGVNEKNMIYLSECLKINTTIEELNLADNNLEINEKNLVHLSEGLKFNKYIRLLDVSENNLGKNENNIINLCEGLKINTSIQKLDLWDYNQGLNKRNTMYLKDCIKANTSIKELFIWYSNFSKEIKEEFPNIVYELDITFKGE